MVKTEGAGNTEAKMDVAFFPLSTVCTAGLGQELLLDHAERIGKNELENVSTGFDVDPYR